MKSDDTVPKRILGWSENRPLWQRDALRRIVLNGYPDEEAFEELLALCKKEHGDQTVTLAAKPLSKDHLPADPGAGESISLSGIANVSGVNQLATGQTLNFEESGLTIVYGQNGTGKSGYTRILKKACRSRHACEIMTGFHKRSSRWLVIGCGSRSCARGEIWFTAIRGEALCQPQRQGP
ncbi:ATP-binding protein [Pseudogemmobacter faecipullorum]|uniref:Rad50/SbcC-type AAA domain-containing protein n=1 Tax=Pseudogemmobacter faecipullorum TaxID=2755041 RepID=A0ABS8CJ24_9RHOB|nr:ATP-binding protein [Pseudogemmobacter faecipullorum]MCB5409402.1 hypothetical protein [Pseudogemmobacter faecipullorum]